VHKNSSSTEVLIINGQKGKQMSGTLLKKNRDGEREAIFPSRQAGN
jgi:hypothetical protein